MSEDGERSGRYAHRLAWGPSARMRARSRLRGAIEGKAGLLPVVEAAATVMCEELAARTVTVTLLQDDYYRDLVKVGEYAPEEAVDPDDRFAAAEYPEATARLLAHEAYVSGTNGHKIIQEHMQIVPPTASERFHGRPDRGRGRSTRRGLRHASGVRTLVHLRRCRGRARPRHRAWHCVPRTACRGRLTPRESFARARRLATATRSEQYVAVGRLGPSSTG